MVEIHEDTTDSQDENHHTRNQPPPPASTPILEYLRVRSTDSILWLLRLATIAFSLLYAFPIFGGPSAQTSAYTKALAAGAATNALRLHQRLGGFRFSREFFATMMLEDSCHYLFYSILFITSSSPITMALLPVLLFAVLHSSNFTVQFLSSCGYSSSFLYRSVRSLTDNYASSLLSLIACTEIFIMPLVVLLIFMGKTSIFLPFIYYRFLTLRYMSQRNPNTKIAFRQLREALESATSSPSCPSPLRSATHTFIAFVSRLAPSHA